MSSRTSTYFASDFHLGIDLRLSSKEREKIIVSWLESIKMDAKAIYLVGDIFDYWFEYKSVIPKGYVRLLGKIAELADLGVEIHFFKGNHDMWVFSYFQDELGVIVHDHELNVYIEDKQFFIAHGDGLGKGDSGYKFVKGIFRSTIAQKLFSLIPPRIGLYVMSSISSLSRHKEVAQLSDINRLVDYAEKLSKSQDFDYFICGHQHNPDLTILSNGVTQYCNLGDWMTHFTYAEWDGSALRIKKYETAVD